MSTPNFFTLYLVLALDKDSAITAYFPACAQDPVGATCYNNAEKVVLVPPNLWMDLCVSAADPGKAAVDEFLDSYAAGYIHSTDWIKEAFPTLSAQGYEYAYIVKLGLPVEDNLADLTGATCFIAGKHPDPETAAKKFLLEYLEFVPLNPAAADSVLTAFTAH